MNGKRQTSDWVGILLVGLAFLGLPAGIMAAAMTDSDLIGFLAMFAPVLLGILVLAILGVLPWRSGAVEARRVSYRGSRFIVPLLGAVGFVVIGTYLRLLWSVALVGCGATIGFWRWRGTDDVRAVIAFLGIFVGLYGILGAYIEWQMQH
jgi:hypothetical protein